MEAPEPGCYIDSHHGHYAHVEAIRLAISFGFPIDPLADWTIQHYERDAFEQDYPMEALMELLDEAEAWLNEHQKVEGCWWMWNDGDFGLYAEGDVD